MNSTNNVKVNKIRALKNFKYVYQKPNKLNEFYEAFFFALKGHLKYETMNKLKTEIKPSKYTSNKNDIISLNTKATNIFDSILCSK